MKTGKLAYIRGILFEYSELKKRNCSFDEMKRIKAVENVIEKIKKNNDFDSECMLKIIDLYYLKHIGNLSDVAYKIHLSDRTAYRLNKRIMALMDSELHLI